MDGRLENVIAVFSLLHLIALEVGSRVQNLRVLKAASTLSMCELYILHTEHFWVLEESSKSDMQLAGVFHSLRSNDKDDCIFFPQAVCSNNFLLFPLLSVYPCFCIV